MLRHESIAPRQATAIAAVCDAPSAARIIKLWSGARQRCCGLAAIRCLFDSPLLR
jgi:hypothetical protein